MRRSMRSSFIELALVDTEAMTYGSAVTGLS
jgi:hypothetical protein